MLCPKGTPALSTKRTTINHLKHIAPRIRTKSIQPLKQRFD